MTTFAYKETAPAGKIVAAALGPNSATKFADADIGKPVKMGTANNYVLCVAGDEIEGFVTSMEPFTVNSGFSFGSVLVNGRKEVVVGTGTVAVGDLVVADTQAVLGTAGDPKVKKGTAASQSGVTPFAFTERTPNTHLWRVISIVSGTGAVGDKVLIERI